MWLPLEASLSTLHHSLHVTVTLQCSANFASVCTPLLCFWSLTDTVISFIFCNKMLNPQPTACSHTNVYTLCGQEQTIKEIIEVPARAMEVSWLAVYLGILFLCNITGVKTPVFISTCAISQIQDSFFQLAKDAMNNVHCDTEMKVKQSVNLSEASVWKKHTGADISRARKSVV